MYDRGSSSRRARRRSGLRSSALATALIGASVLVGTSLFVSSAAAAALCATPPLTGTTSATGVIDTYYPGLTTITAGTANTTVTVGTSRGAATPIAVGDLVLVIQMQGAQIDSTNTDSYGDGVPSATASGYLSTSFIAGLYEYATVRSVAGAVVGLNGAGTNGGLVNTFVNAAESATQGRQRFQIIRVPQYSSATLSSVTPPAAVAWDGSTGGIVALDVANDLNLNGTTIDTTGQGFRPGLQRTRSGATGLANTDYRTATANTANGQKAEGIAGTAKWTTGALDTVGDGYPNGDFGRGAPGNAGGGGTDGNPAANDQNSGGGGGGNGGAGGQGGNTWSSNLDRGGHGGVAVPGTSSRVFLGGGGGAGSDNNAVGSSAGGAGGGMVLVRAGSLSGTGTIIADGAPGNASGQDGSGGGGAGGSVVVLTTLTGAASGIGGLTVNARGGAGGNETHASQHGPGGGGGGGRVVTSAATGSTVVTGGVNGIHVATSSAYGATAGTAGASSITAVMGDAPGTNTGSLCLDVSVTKSASPAPVIPGQTVIYTVVATNNGPYPRSGTAPVVVTDTLPAGLSSATWTCAASAGSNCTASGSGSLNTTADLEVGDSATYTITATLSATFTGTLSNTATVAGPAAIPELNTVDNTATAAVLAEPHVDLGVTKTDGVASAVPGTNVTYTIVASNAGPSTATSASITDALPSDTTSGTWTCVAGSGGTCGAANGTMPMSTSATLSPAGSVTYTVVVAVSSTATGSLANSVTITAPAGAVETNSANNVATDTDSLTPTADLSITKTDNDTNARPGDPIAYQIVVANAGPSAVTGATVVDSMPVGIVGITWTCAAGVAATCPSSGTGDLNELVDLGVGGTVTFTVTGTVTATTGTLTNTAQIDEPPGATDPNIADNVATDTTQVDPVGDLSITKTDGLTSAVPGAANSYTVVVSNGGPSAADGVVVDDTLPSTLSGATWTCTATPGSNCSSPVGTGDVAQLVDVAAGGTVSFLVTATIASDATGVLANTAALTPPPSFTDTNVANNSATDLTDLAPTVDLAITKSDGQPVAVPGTSITYTVTVTNAGPSASAGSRVLDSLPAALTGATWTCSAAPGSSCASASGSGSIDQIDTIAVGGTVSYIISATVSPTAAGVLTNTATVTPASGTTDSNPGNNSAIDVDTVTPLANLSVTKTDGAASVVPGTPITYSIVVGNAGPSSVSGASVVDAMPAVLTNASWTCTGNAGGLCGVASGTGSIATTASLPSGATVTYTVTATVSASATGVVANTATVAAPVGVTDPDTSDNSSIDVDSLTPSVDLAITKTDGTATAVAGTSTTYVITVANSGPSTATGAQISDVLPSELSSATWACTSSGGATCATTNGSGNVSLLASLPTGGSVTITLVAAIDPAASGFVVNTAMVTEPPGEVDSDLANNAATDSDSLARVADLSITKTDGLVSALPGDAITYTVVVGNNGPSSVLGALVNDTMPSGLTGATWTCGASPGSACATPSGTGDISTAVDLALGGSATFTVHATIAASQLGTVTNTATIVTPAGVNDPASSNNVATDTTVVNGLGDVSITKTDGVSTIVAGTATAYTIVVTNPGPSQINGVQVIDTVPLTLSGVTWTCNPAGAAVCGTPSGSGSINDLVDMPAASSATFVVSANVVASASGVLSNTASVTLPSSVVDSDLTNNQATDLTDIEQVADLAVTKTDNVTSVTPGNAVDYDITVVNSGPSAVTGATVSDVIPATISSATYTCTPSAGAACGSPSGNVSLSADLAVGASVVLHVSGAVSPSATGTLVNTAVVTPPPGVTDPVAINNTATDSDALNPIADVSVAKTNGVTSQSPGATSSYTITVANAGPSAAAGVAITDPLPTGVTTAWWTCSAAVGSSCAAASGIGAISTTLDLAAAGTATFTVSMQSPPSAGTLTNTVVATVPPGITDPDPSNNIASDTDTLVFTADVAVTKTSSSAVVAAGQPLTYTVVVVDNGPDAADGVTVLDSVPAGLVNTTWTCTATPGSSCPAAGTGDISVTVDLAAGGSATFTMTSTTTTSSPATIVNTATAAVGPNTVDSNPANNADSAIVTVDFTAVLAVQKTANAATVLPGDTFSYTIVVSNAGPARLDGVAISDPVPAGLVALSWTCLGNAGATCLTTSGTGSPLLSVNLPNGGFVTITLDVRAALDASGAILNVVTATGGPAGQQVVAQASANVDVSPVVPTSPALSISKTTSTTTYSAVGAVVTYTLVATNTGNATLTNVTISDANATVAGCAPVTLAPGERLTCSASHVVTQTDLDRGAVTNSASVTGLPPSGPAITATSETVVVEATRITNLSLVKTSSSAAFARAGDRIAFTIVATNDGNVTLTNVTISDPNAVVENCPATDLAPGETITCTAVHTVTAADVAAKVISNQARATALPMISLELVCPLTASDGAPCPLQAAVSAESNTVVLNRVAPLPTTGATVLSKLILGGGLLGVGEFLLLVCGRRRRRPAR